MPSEFWSLTVREFRLKHEGLIRSEDRLRSLIMEHAAMAGHHTKQDQSALLRNVNILRRYPVKAWLKSPSD